MANQAPAAGGTPAVTTAQPLQPVPQSNQNVQQNPAVMNQKQVTFATPVAQTVQSVTGPADAATQTEPAPSLGQRFVAPFKSAYNYVFGGKPAQSATGGQQTTQTAPTQTMTNGQPAQAAPAQTTTTGQTTQAAPAQTTTTGQTTQVAPVQTAPVQTAPVQTAPVQTAPAQTAPVQTAPAQTAPAQTTTTGQTTQTAPVQTAPAQTTTTGQTTQTAPATTNGTSTPATETKKTVVEFHKPNWKERFVAAAKVVGSYIAAPFKFAAKAIDFLVWTPLKNYVITPIYVGFLYVFNRAKYDARKLGLEAEANKAAHELKQANDRALEKECIDLARAQYDKTTTDLMYTRLAAKYGVKAKDVEKRVELHKPHTDANEEFNTKLADGSLALLKQVGVDPKTGEKQYRTQTVLKATDQVLDADKADVAKRLGNYNIALEAHKKKLKEWGEAAEQAKKDGKPVPAMPELTAPSVFKCTDKSVIEAYNNTSPKHLENVKAKAAALDNELNKMRAEFKEAHPDGHDHDYVIENDDHKAQVEGTLKEHQQALQEQQAKLAKYQAEGDNHPMVPPINEGITEQKRRINILERNLAIYPKERELFAVRKEISDLEVAVPVYRKQMAEDVIDRQNRDRLNTKGWNAPVTKDENGNATKDPKQVTHQERTFEEMITPEYNGRKMPNPVPYKDQKGESWSKTNPEQRPYGSYMAVKGEDGKILKDREGNVVDWEAAAGQLKNHWVVKHSYVNGKHAGYDKYTLAVKKTEPVIELEPTPPNTEVIDSEGLPVVPNTPAPEQPAPQPPGVKKFEKNLEILGKLQERTQEAGRRASLTAEDVARHDKMVAGRDLRQTNSAPASLNGELDENTNAMGCLPYFAAAFETKEAGEQLRLTKEQHLQAYLQQQEKLRAQEVGDNPRRPDITPADGIERSQMMARRMEQLAAFRESAPKPVDEPTIVPTHVEHRRGGEEIADRLDYRTRLARLDRLEHLARLQRYAETERKLEETLQSPRFAAVESTVPGMKSTRV